MQIALAVRPFVARGTAVAGKGLARERLMHGAEDRLTHSRQCDQGSPDRHSGDEGFGAIDRVQHPDIFRVGAVATEFFADDAMFRKGTADHRPHRLFGGAIGGSHRIEFAGRTFVVNADRGSKKRQDGLAGDRGKLFDECREIDSCHARHPYCTPIKYQHVFQKFVLCALPVRQGSFRTKPHWNQ